MIGCGRTRFSNISASLRCLILRERLVASRLPSAARPALRGLDPPGALPSIWQFPERHEVWRTVRGGAQRTLQASDPPSGAITVIAKTRGSPPRARHSRRHEQVDWNRGRDPRPFGRAASFRAEALI